MISTIDYFSDQGDAADFMYFIVKGKVSVRMLSAVSKAIP